GELRAPDAGQRQQHGEEEEDTLGRGRPRRGRLEEERNERVLQLRDPGDRQGGHLGQVVPGVGQRVDQRVEHFVLSLTTGSPMAHRSRSRSSVDSPPPIGSSASAPTGPGPRGEAPASPSRGESARPRGVARGEARGGEAGGWRGGGTWGSWSGTTLG